MVSEKKSITDFLDRKTDLPEEIHKLAERFEEEFVDSFGLKRPSLEEKIGKGGFLKWSHRETYLSPSELKKVMGIEDIRRKELDDKKIIFYLEYILNMLHIFSDNNNVRNIHEYNPIADLPYEQIADSLYKNIEIILSQHNLEKYEVKKCLYRIITKNAAVDEALKVVDPSIRYLVLEYNHVSIREDIGKKRDILCNLYHDFEQKRDELKKTSDGKSIASDLGFIFNNLDIRHNNVKGKHLNNAIKDMSEQEMREWYDKCFQIYITSVLFYEYSTKHKYAIKKLKENS